MSNLSNVYFHASWQRMDSGHGGWDPEYACKENFGRSNFFPMQRLSMVYRLLLPGKNYDQFLTIMTNSVIVWCTSLTKGNQAMTNCNKWLEALKCCGTLMKHPFSALEPIIWIFVQGPLNIGVKIARWSKTALYAQEPLSEQFRALFDQIFPCTIFLGER